MRTELPLARYPSVSVVGCFEHVSLPQLGIRNQLAKIDTGAYSGAIHCTDLKVVRRGADKTRVLKFTPLGRKKLATETDTFVETFIRSATGHRVKRFLIDTELVHEGKSYPIRIGLSDRSDMKRSILVGRRFLRENKIIVDVTINQELDDEGKNS